MTIQDTLKAWLADPSAVADDNLDAPTEKALTVALALSHILDAIRVVPSGAGGVIFKWEDYIYIIKRDGSLEMRYWGEDMTKEHLRWTIKEENS